MGYSVLRNFENVQNANENCSFNQDQTAQTNENIGFLHVGVELYLSRGKLAVSDICVLWQIQRKNKVIVPLTMQFGSRDFYKYEIYS